MTRPSKADLARLRAGLETRHAELQGELERIQRGAIQGPEGAGVAERQDDEGVVLDTHDDDVDVLAHEVEVLESITEALERAREGTYGRCEECGGWIDRERLEVVPYAKHCIRCARRESGT